MEWITHSHFKCKKKKKESYYCAPRLPIYLFLWGTQGRTKINGKQVRENSVKKWGSLAHIQFNQYFKKKKKSHIYILNWCHFFFKYILNTKLHFMYCFLCSLYSEYNKVKFCHLVPLKHHTWGERFSHAIFWLDGIKTQWQF